MKKKLDIQLLTRLNNKDEDVRAVLRFFNTEHIGETYDSLEQIIGGAYALAPNIEVFIMALEVFAYASGYEEGMINLFTKPLNDN